MLLVKLVAKCAFDVGEQDVVSHRCGDVVSTCAAHGQRQHMRTTIARQSMSGAPEHRCAHRGQASAVGCAPNAQARVAWTCVGAQR